MVRNPNIFHKILKELYFETIYDKQKENTSCRS